MIARRPLSNLASIVTNKLPLYEGFVLCKVIVIYRLFLHIGEQKRNREENQQDSRRVKKSMRGRNKGDDACSLFALSNPLLDSLTHALDLVDSLVVAHLRVCLSGLNEVGDTVADTDVVVTDNGVLLLVLPDKVADIASSDGQNSIRGTHTSSHGNNTAQQDVAVASNDATSHGSYKHVDTTRQKTLTTLSGGSKRLHCGNKRVLEIQSFGKAGIDVVFGFDGLGVQEDAGTLDLLGKALGGCWACGLTKDSGGDGLGSDFCGLGLVVADWRSDRLGVEGGRVDSGG